MELAITHAMQAKSQQTAQTSPMYQLGFSDGHERTSDARGTAIVGTMQYVAGYVAGQNKARDERGANFGPKRD